MSEQAPQKNNEQLNEIDEKLLDFSNWIEKENVTESDRAGLKYFKDAFKKNGNKLSVEMVLETHKKIMADKSADFTTGEIRKVEVGVGYKTLLSAKDVEKNLLDIIDWYNDLSQEYKNDLEILKIFHIVFLYIHPFQDGNGRMSRIISHTQAQAFNLRPNWLYDLPKKTDSLSLYYSLFKEDKKLFKMWREVVQEWKNTKI